MFFDRMYLIFLGPGLLLGGFASLRVRSTFKRYSEVPAASGLSGAEVARRMLRDHGINDVTIERHEGFLSDHYDPSARAVRLSPDVHDGRSLAALGVAAHECGHVLQHAKGYALMHVRQRLVGPANFGSTAAILLSGIGVAINAAGLAWLGVLAFLGVVLFQLATLPVEFNASTRAREHLANSGIISAAERDGVARVLSAAALTYVAALVTAILQLAYFAIRAAGMSRSDD